MTTRTTRRRALRAGAGALIVSLAGCLGDGGDPSSEGTGGRGRTPDSTPAATGTSLPDPATDEGTPESTPRGDAVATRSVEVQTPEGGTGSDAVLLPSVEVEGSPGGLVSIHPPGTVVLMDFFATWCPPCEPEMVNLRDARARFDASEVFIVSITPERDRDAIATFWEDNGGTWPVVMDPDLRATVKYGVTTTPTALAFAPDGTEVFRHTGLAGPKRILTAIGRGLEAGTD